ncbi:MAG: nucleotidyltransferase family protein [Bacteroidales bacterium]|nr:nucleotidyltransferase family protein [Bacteroidales bacterium]
MTSGEVLLLLLRAAIHGEIPVSLPVAVDWKEVSELATRQGVGAIAADGLQKLLEAHPEWGKELDEPENETVKYEWFGQTFYAEQCYEKYTRAIASLAKFYNEHGFQMMILKGYACSLNYPVPNHRPCGDIDIWQFGRQKEADAALAREKGVKIDNSHHHHTVFFWKGEMVENHYDIINVYHHRSNRDLEQVFKALASDDSHTTEVHGQTVCLPSPNLHALFLARHAAGHFAAAEILLRHLLDWALYVKAYGSQIDWTWLQETVERFGMTGIFRCFNAICVEDLGFDASLFPVESLQAPEEKDRVLADILSPEVSQEIPKHLIPRILWKYRRWKANEWKHRLCYKESMRSAFWSGVWTHLRKPSSI